ncbi:hypothetical protein NBRC110019_11710 [Neptunitalea chrysea]|uniref:DUF2851 family protein n=1 Tax=Neptunitalea chrysea TaxID=1647581 RepID=A0A9W6EV58_9FLAO|nr:DUF2851 family protein [Neptunitalea chrysea]GLB52132.1 hypothetical protein NBRC110019_11710 [Neptunitalea chrysea]
MKEDFLHYLWKFKKIDFRNSKTTNGLSIEVKRFGVYNELSGADFFNALVLIDGQYWAGNIEMHLRSSYWFMHGHEKDAAYNNVILHVVWEHDVEVFNSNNQPIPVLELKNVVPASLLNTYLKLVESKHHFINCEHSLSSIDSFVIESWLERLYIDRLREKSMVIQEMLKHSNNNWEAVLFKLLMKNFGGNINGAAFLSIANSCDFSIIRKFMHDRDLFESFLFGQSGLLESEIPSSYEKMLYENYQFLCSKFNLSKLGVLPIQFFKLRPHNFPTIRFSQLAGVYKETSSLFSLLIEANTFKEIKEIIKVKTSGFWEKHYTFNKKSNKVVKCISDSFIHLLIINTIIPLKFCYLNYKSTVDTDPLLKVLYDLPPEKNSIVANFVSCNLKVKNSLHSQALLHLYQNLCSKNKCLQCVLGVKLLKEE